MQLRRAASTCQIHGWLKREWDQLQHKKKTCRLNGQTEARGIWGIAVKHPILYDTITSCALWNKESEDVPLDQLTSACNLEPDPWNYSSGSDELLEIWFWRAGEPGATLREAWGAFRKPCGTLHNLAARSDNSGARSEKLGLRSENSGGTFRKPWGTHKGARSNNSEARSENPGHVQ